MGHFSVETSRMPGSVLSGNQQPKRTLLDCGRHGGDVTAARIAARRQFIRVIATLQTESQGVILQVVVQNRSLTEIEPSPSRRRRCVEALRSTSQRKRFRSNTRRPGGAASVEAPRRWAARGCGSQSLTKSGDRA